MAPRPAARAVRPRRTATATVVAAIVTLTTVAGCAGLPGWRSEGEACGAHRAPNVVVAEIPLEHAALVGLRTPALAWVVDHLDADARATLVVFDGPGRDSELFAPTTSAVASAAPDPDDARIADLCVVAADGSTRLVRRLDVAPLLQASGG